MDPVTTGALIQTGGQLAGGVISKVSGKKAAKKAYKRQKEFAQNAIQWKVKDAKAAGLHPLYAMGGGGANYQPSFIAGQDPLGSAVSGAAETTGAAYTQSQAPPPGTPSGVMGQAQLRAVNASAQRDEAAAIRDLSAAKRMEGQVNHTQDTSAQLDIPGLTQHVPREITSGQIGDPSTSAGKGRGFQEIVIGKRPDGSLRTMKVLKAEDPAEGMEGMGALGLSILKNMGILDWQDYDPTGPYRRLFKRAISKKRSR